MMMLLGVSTLVASLLDVKPYLHLQFVPHMTKYHQVGVILLVLFFHVRLTLLKVLADFNTSIWVCQFCRAANG